MASHHLKIRGPQTSDVWKGPVITITETMLEFGCHAFLPNWLFWCSFFFSPILFLREHGCHPPLTSLDEENLVGFQLHPARTFRRSFDGKKSHWRPQGPHWPPFIYQHITLHFWFLARNEWGGKVTCEWHTVCTWTYVLYEVCVSAGWCFYFVCVCVWGCNERGSPGTHKPHEGSPNLHN